jgi:hypothetical protein
MRSRCPDGRRGIVERKVGRSSVAVARDEGQKDLLRIHGQLDPGRFARCGGRCDLTNEELTDGSLIWRTHLLMGLI